MHLLELACCNPDITCRFPISVRGNVPGYIVYKDIYLIKLAYGMQLYQEQQSVLYRYKSKDFDNFKPVIISAVMVMNMNHGLVIAVITKYPQLREDRTTLFIFSLTLSGLANGGTAMPISAAVCSNASPNVSNMLMYVPRVLQVCSIWVSYTSVHSLCWVTVKNYCDNETAPI